MPDRATLPAVMACHSIVREAIEIDHGPAADRVRHVDRALKHGRELMAKLELIHLQLLRESTVRPQPQDVARTTFGRRR